MTNVLASEAQTVNGASTEGLAVILESTFAIGCGIIIGFVYSWRLSLVCLACVPFMMLGGAINAKMSKGMNDVEEKAYRDANLLAGDSIINFRTVAGLSSDKLIIRQYD